MQGNHSASPAPCCVAACAAGPTAGALVAPLAAWRCRLTPLPCMECFPVMTSSATAASNPKMATRWAASLRLVRFARRASARGGRGTGDHCACASDISLFQGGVSSRPGCSASAYLAVVSVIHRCGPFLKDAIGPRQIHTYMFSSVNPEAADRSLRKPNYQVAPSEWQRAVAFVSST